MPLGCPWAFPGRPEASQRPPGLKTNQSNKPRNLKELIEQWGGPLGDTGEQIGEGPMLAPARRDSLAINIDPGFGPTEAHLDSQRPPPPYKCLQTTTHAPTGWLPLPGSGRRRFLVCFEHAGIVDQFKNHPLRPPLPPPPAG